MFKLTAGAWVFLWGFVYFVAGLINVFVYHFMSTTLLQMLLIVVLALPLFIPSLANKLKVPVIWKQWF